MSKRTNRIFMPALSLLVLSSLLYLTSCGEDDPKPKEPIVSISNATFAGDIGDAATTTISGELDGDFAVLRITKYIGTDIDTGYGTGGTMEVTSGLPYNFSHTLGVDGLLEPIRFNFVVVDENDLSATVDFIITTNASRTALMSAFNWRYSELLFGDPPANSIQPCEEDNIYMYDASGTMSVDYGPLTGSGGGSCDFDDVTEWVGWSFNEDETILSQWRADIVDGVSFPKDTLKWTIVDFDQTGWSATEESIFGPLTYGFTAQAK